MEKVKKETQNIVSVTKKVPVKNIAETIGPLFMTLMNYIETQGANCISNPFVSYKNLNADGEIDGTDVEIEVGLPIDKMIPSKKDIKCYILPAYTAVQVLFKGTHEQLNHPFEKILEEIKRLNGAYLGVTYEYYLTDENVAMDQQQTLLEVPYR